MSQTVAWLQVKSNFTCFCITWGHLLPFVCIIWVKHVYSIPVPMLQNSGFWLSNCQMAPLCCMNNTTAALVALSDMDCQLGRCWNLIPMAHRANKWHTLVWMQVFLLQSLNCHLLNSNQQISSSMFLGFFIWQFTFTVSFCQVLKQLESLLGCMESLLLIADKTLLLLCYSQSTSTVLRCDCIFVSFIASNIISYIVISQRMIQITILKYWNGY